MFIYGVVFNPLPSSSQSSPLCSALVTMGTVRPQWNRRSLIDGWRKSFCAVLDNYIYSYIVYDIIIIINIHMYNFEI